MKNKILAISTILLLLTIPFGVVGANELQATQQSEQSMSIEIGILDEDNSISVETLTLDEEELIELEEMITVLMNEIESAENWQEIESILNNHKTNGIIGTIITRLLSKLSLFRSRGFVISSGHFYKLNPFKKSRIKLHKGFGFWHYSSGKIFKDRTIIIKPLQFNIKILKGIQFGFMYKFFGIYIIIPKKIPDKSYSFFMGTTKRINGIQLHR